MIYIIIKVFFFSGLNYHFFFPEILKYCLNYKYIINIFFNNNYWLYEGSIKKNSFAEEKKPELKGNKGIKRNYNTRV